MLAGLPVEQRDAKIAGVPTVLLEGGAGAPLLLLHGGIECGGAIWAPVIEALAARHRVIVPDVPGFGESAPLPELTPSTFAVWAEAMIEHTCDEAPVVIAHSLIGNFAARFADAHGTKLRRLVVYAAPGIGPYKVPLRLRVVAIRFAVRPTASNAERFERFALLDRDRTRQRDPEWFDAFGEYGLERARTRHVKRAMSQLIRQGTRRVPDDDLRRIPVPVGAIWGREDRMTPLRVAKETLERLEWPVATVEDSAHVPHLEQPERFLTALADLSETPRPVTPGPLP